MQAVIAHAEGPPLLSPAPTDKEQELRQGPDAPYRSAIRASPSGEMMAATALWVIRGGLGSSRIYLLHDMFNRTLCATRRLALGCSFRSLVEDCSSAFENGAHFLGVEQFAAKGLF